MNCRLLWQFLWVGSWWEEYVRRNSHLPVQFMPHWKYERIDHMQVFPWQHARVTTEFISQILRTYVPIIGYKSLSRDWNVCIPTVPRIKDKCKSNFIINIFVLFSFLDKKYVVKNNKLFLVEYFDFHLKVLISCLRVCST